MNFTFSFNYGVPKSPPKFHVILKWFGYPYFELLMTFFNFRAWWLNISLQTMSMVNPLTSCFIWCKINNFAQISTWISHPSNLIKSVILPMRQMYMNCKLNVFAHGTITCVWLRVFQVQKGPLLWMPISLAILNQIRQFQCT